MMKQLVTMGIAVVALLGSVAVPVQLVDAQESVSDSDQVAPESFESIDWQYDIGQASLEGLQHSRQLVAVFITDWCRWCDSLDAVTFSDDRVIALQERLIFVRVNAEADTASATKFGIRRYPTSVLLTSEGNEVDRIIGFVDPKEFVDRMTDYLAGRETLWDLERKHQQNNRDTELMLAVAKKKFERGNLEDARGLLDRIVQMDSKNEAGHGDEATFLLARMDREERNWYKAIEGFRTLVKTFPKSEFRRDAELYIPWLYAQAGDTASAVRHYESFLDNNGGSKSADWVKAQLGKLQPPEESNMSDDPVSP